MRDGPRSTARTSRPISCTRSRRSISTTNPEKGDQRQMEAWQRIGTYAAGLALEDAGLKGNVRSSCAHGHDCRRRAANAISVSMSKFSTRNPSLPTLGFPERKPDERPAAYIISSRSFPICSPATFLSCTASPAPRAPSWARKAPERCRAHCVRPHHGRTKRSRFGRRLA